MEADGAVEAAAGAPKAAPDALEAALAGAGAPTPRQPSTPSGPSGALADGMGGALVTPQVRLTSGAEPHLDWHCDRLVEPSTLKTGARWDDKTAASTHEGT